MSWHAPRMVQGPAALAAASALMMVVAAGLVPGGASAAPVAGAPDGGGAVVAWGANEHGQTTVPAAARSLAFTDVAAGDDFSIGLTAAGQVVSWGSAPAAPAGISDQGITAIAAAGDHALALTPDGRVIAWGSQTSVPSRLASDSVTAIAAGADFDLALTAGGSVVAWGTDAAVISGAADVHGVSAIAAGDDTALAVVNGYVTAWGAAHSDVLDVPAGLTHVTAVAAGTDHALALTNGGTVTAWGSSTAGQADVPSGLAQVSAIAAGGDQSLAVGPAGAVTVWGENSHQQRSVPASLATAGGILAVAAGRHHIVAAYPSFVITPAPQVDGSTVKGGTLTVDAGMWTPAPDSLSYQWNAGTAPIDGATDTSFTTTDAQVGRQLSVTVTAHRVGYPDRSVTSSPTDVISGGTFETPPMPTVTGTPRVDGQLSAQPGTWTPTPDHFTYQWTADGADIPNATLATFTPNTDQLDKAISVKVTGVLAGYAPATALSNPTRPVSQGSLSLQGRPAITGTAKVGSTLTVAAGAWTPTPASYAYQWYAGNAAISGARNASLTLTADQAGLPITVDVTARRSGYQSSTVASQATAVVTGGSFTRTAAATISGSTTVGETLTVNPGSLTPAPAAFTYQWRANGVDIANATASSFVTSAAQLGATISVVVTATKPGFTSVATAVGPTAMVDGGVFGQTPTPTISGQAVVGHTVSVESGLWDPAAHLSVQWIVGGQPIAGATAHSLAITNSLAGKPLRVRLTATADGYLPVERVSDSALVTGGSIAARGLVSIRGSLTYGHTLTAHPGTWPTGSTLSYRWVVGDSASVRGTSPTFVTSVDDLGQHVKLLVTASKPGFADATAQVTTRGIVSGGRFRVGGTLTAPRFAVSPKATITYRWYAGAKPIANATRTSLVAGSAQRGRRLSVHIQASRPGYTTVRRVTSATHPVGVYWQRNSPTISGTAHVGHLLTAHLAGWAPEPTSVSYQWYANGRAIRGATTASYRVTTRNQARQLTVRATAQRHGYLSLSRRSAGVWVPQTGPPRDRFR